MPLLPVKVQVVLDGMKLTASEDVWNAFLVSHPNAKRFKNTPFLKYTNYQVIFEGKTATGALHISSSTSLIEEHEEGTPDESVQPPEHLAHLLNDLGSVHLAVTKSPLAIVLKIPSADESMRWWPHKRPLKPQLKPPQSIAPSKSFKKALRLTSP
ncbi:hypothetical protein PCANC_25390 [Puccinia coronata f. sp. avenae]|uniref:Uncharacterized protein n=1 Tax=Puccinia coronata f. sp. avenae TaxID=200324 RepID=A0A2N5TR11_9BASI|nr:hypothetical protein PCANC_25390 [Puccinia coronata f. sp. avenae]